MSDTTRSDSPPTHPMAQAFISDIVAGLSTMPKSLPAKWFYDDVGAKLFEGICELPEYYLTRTERSILESSAAEIVAALGEDTMLVEFGSGSMSKVRIILDQFIAPNAFVAVDISAEQLADAAKELEAAYSGLRVFSVATDFTRPFDLPADLDTSQRRCVFFPGSTIGNFNPQDAKALLAHMRTIAGPDGRLLIGFDLKKDSAVLEAAYDDAAGVTADFNKNILARINRELGGDVNVDAFAHVAFYNDIDGRIEMHLKSIGAQSFSVGGHTFHFADGETIHTENSYKYAVKEFEQLAGAAGLHLARTWTDSEDKFALLLFDVTNTG